LQKIKGISKALALVLDRVLKIRDTSCFTDCCYGKGGALRAKCHGGFLIKLTLDEWKDRDVIVDVKVVMRMKRDE